MKSHSSSRESKDKEIVKLPGATEPGYVVRFRDCITIVLKLNLKSRSHIIELPKSQLEFEVHWTKNYSLTKHLCQAPEPALILRFHNGIMIMSKPCLGQFRPRLADITIYL